jgi:HK97 family phage portal protein
MDQDLTKSVPVPEGVIGGPFSSESPDLWQDLFGLPIDYHPWIGWNVPGPSSLAGEGMSLAITCATVKARDIAKAEMQLWRLNSQGGYDFVKPNQHWLAKLLSRRPNAHHTWDEFWRLVVTHREMAQNAYILKIENRLGEVTQLVPWVPSRCRMRISLQNNVFYEIMAANEFEQAMLGQGSTVVPARRIIHLKGRMWNGFDGMSNEVIGSPIFALTDAITRYQTNLFGNDGRQPMVYETDKEFGTSDQATAAFNRLKQQLREATAKMNRQGDAILLEAGLTAKPIGANPKDALAPEAYKSMVQRICALMDMPPHKIYQLDPVKYNNQAQMDATYASSVLEPVAQNIEHHFRLDVLPEDEQDELFPEFDRMGLLAGDPESLMKVMKDAMLLGGMTHNEMRDRLPLALGPIEGGDTRMVPVNVRLVDENGEEVMKPETPAAPNPNAPNDQQAQDLANQNRSPDLRVVK